VNGASALPPAGELSAERHDEMRRIRGSTAPFSPSGSGRCVASPATRRCAAPTSCRH